MQKSYILPLIILMFLIVPIASAMDAVNVINPPTTGGSGNTYINNTYIVSEMNQTPNQTPGQSATIVINSTTTLAAGASAFVTNIGTSLNAIWDIGIPQGAQGVKGDPGAAGYTPVSGVDYFNGTNGTNGVNGTAATVSANYTFTLPYGNPATVTNVGTTSAALFDFGIPTGATGSTGAAGTNGTNGTNGTAATIVVNYTFTGIVGSNANVTNVGTQNAAAFDFTIPVGATGAKGDTGATGGTGGQVLFFRNFDSTDPPTYEGLVPTPFGAPEVDENATINDVSGKVLIDSYITDIGYPAITKIPAGLWIFRSFPYVSSPIGTTTLVFDVYNRTAGGTETLLFSVTSPAITAASPSSLDTSYAQASDYFVSTSDRIVVKVSAQTTKTGAGITYHWIYEGTAFNANIQTPISAVTASSLSVGMKSDGSALYKGQAVYISGASGGVPVVDKADNLLTAKTRVIGLVDHDVAANTNVNIIRVGVLTNVDTRSTNANINPLGQTWTAGDLLFATSSGGLTNVRPTSGRSVKAAYTLTGSSATDSLLAYPFENPVWVTAAANEDVVLRVGDSAGTNKVSIRNYSNSEVAYINSNGVASLHGADMQSQKITSVLDPTADQDAATKKYVDDHSGTSASTTFSYYTLPFMALTGTPGNGATNYMGGRPVAASTTAGTNKMYIPATGVIERAEVYTYSGTAGTNEAWSYYVLLNNQADTLIQTQSLNTNERIFSNAALSIAVNAGDYIEIKRVNPTWVSQPATTIVGGYVFINTTVVAPATAGYTIPVMALTSSPGDGATVYFGNLPKAPVANAATSKVYIPKTGNITRAELYVYSGTAGTAEGWSLYVRKNNAADTLIATVSNSASERVFRNTGLNIAVNAGDYIEIKGIQPTWATNPLTTIYGGYLYITG